MRKLSIAAITIAAIGTVALTQVSLLQPKQPEVARVTRVETPQLTVTPKREPKPATPKASRTWAIWPWEWNAAPKPVATRKPRTIESVPAKPTDDEVRRAAWAKAEKRLAQADEAILRHACDCYGEVQDYFDRRRAGARAFAESCLGIEAKAAFAESILPFGDGQALKKLVTRNFYRHVLDPNEFDKVVRGAVSRFLSGMEAEENRLFVDLRADLPGLPMIAELPSFSTQSVFATEFSALLGTLQDDITMDVGVSIASLVVSQVTADLVTPVVMDACKSLQRELGNPNAEGEDPLASMLMNFVIGYAVENVIDETLKRNGCDPAKDIINKVNDAMERLHTQLLVGDGKKINRYQALMSQIESAASEEERKQLAAEADRVKKTGTTSLMDAYLMTVPYRHRDRNRALQALILGTPQEKPLLIDKRPDPFRPNHGNEKPC